MPNRKISQLPSTATTITPELQDTDQVPLARSGSTYSILGSNISTPILNSAQSTMLTKVNSLSARDSATIDLNFSSSSYALSANIVNGSVSTQHLSAGAVTTQIIAASAVTPVKLSQPLTLRTAQALAPGSSTSLLMDFTDIPSWAKRVTVMLNNVSLTGTSNPLIQLGSVSLTITGYNAYSLEFGSAAGAGSGYTTGFGIRYDKYPEVMSGLMTIVNISGNTWVAQGSFGIQANATGYFSAGSVTLPGTLDRVRLTTVNGTNAFDGGIINVMYEG